jgi:short-subunit dehydrogenase
MDAYNQGANIILLAYKNKEKLLKEFSKYDKNRVFIYACDATKEDEVKKVFKDLNNK